MPPPANVGEGLAQAAARLYLSLRDVSKHEFRAVAARLANSARTFRLDKRSCNDFAHALTRHELEVAPLLE